MTDIRPPRRIAAPYRIGETRSIARRSCNLGPNLPEVAGCKLAHLGASSLPALGGKGEQRAISFDGEP